MPIRRPSPAAFATPSLSVLPTRTRGAALRQTLRPRLRRHAAERRVARGQPPPRPTVRAETRAGAAGGGHPPPLPLPPPSPPAAAAAAGAAAAAAFAAGAPAVRVDVAAAAVDASSRGWDPTTLGALAVGVGVGAATAQVGLGVERSVTVVHDSDGDGDGDGDGGGGCGVGGDARSGGVCLLVGRVDVAAAAGAAARSLGVAGGEVRVRMFADDGAWGADDAAGVATVVLVAPARTASKSVITFLRDAADAGTPVVILNAFEAPSPVASAGAYPVLAVAVAPIAYLFYPFAVVGSGGRERGGGGGVGGSDTREGTDSLSASSPPPRRMALVGAYPSRFVLYTFEEEDKAYAAVTDWAECPSEAALYAAVGRAMEAAAGGERS